MATPDERMKILKMLEEDKLSAEEASRLLRALSRGSSETRPAAQEGDSKWMRIRVTDLDGDRAAVNVNLPMRLVSVALRLGAQFIPEEEDINLEELAEALQAGLTGKIVDVIDEEEGRQVEIYVE